MIDLKFHKKLAGSGGKMTLDIDLSIEQGDFVTIYGPSGAGKTTLLRSIAGLLTPDHGRIVVNNEVWFDDQQAINLKPQQRGTGLVFQDYALFPNLSVRENINYATRGDSTTFSEVVELMNLVSLLERMPATLSGGQQQRVALARSIVHRPEILMLDEPMSALDMKMRSNIQDYLLAAHKKFNLTTIMVSHDVGEIFKLANKVFHLECGQVIKAGSPTELFTSRSTSGKFQFAGEVLEIVAEDVIYVLTILIGNNLVKVVAEEATASELQVGDKVMVSSKAFNPIVQKLN